MAPTRTEALPPIELWTTTSLLIVALLAADHTNPANGNAICQRLRHFFQTRQFENQLSSVWVCAVRGVTSSPCLRRTAAISGEGCHPRNRSWQSWLCASLLPPKFRETHFFRPVRPERWLSIDRRLRQTKALHYLWVGFAETPIVTPCACRRAFVCNYGILAIRTHFIIRCAIRISLNSPCQPRARHWWVKQLVQEDH
jgi:hypothetical protein